MTTIRTYSNQAEAAFFVSLLQSRGFDAVLLDEASHAWNYAWGTTPIRLQVPDEQASEAAAYLVTAASEIPDSESGSDNPPAN